MNAIHISIGLNYKINRSYKKNNNMYVKYHNILYDITRTYNNNYDTNRESLILTNVSTQTEISYKDNKIFKIDYMILHARILYLTI